MAAPKAALKAAPKVAPVAGHIAVVKAKRTVTIAPVGRIAITLVVARTAAVEVGSHSSKQSSWQRKPSVIAAGTAVGLA